VGSFDDVRGPTIFIAETSAAQNQQAEWYDPATEHVALFQEAINLDMSNESLLQFVNDWGMPIEPRRSWLRGNRNDLVKLTPDEIDRRVEPGVALDSALRHPWRIGRAARAWEILKSASASQVRDLFQRTAGGKWVYLDRGPTGELRMPLDRELRNLADHGDFRTILMRMLQDTTNGALSLACSPALLWEPNSRSFQLKMIPHHLFGFLWVQFAEAVAGDKEFRQCASCARWMEIAPGQGRPEKSYCSDACRMRAYRRRKSNRSLRRDRKAAVR
jgi:hypothetical protein